MARIPDHELERLKRDVDLVELVRAHGVQLKGTGDTLIGLCPHHRDTKPSLVVTKSKNLWACKGECSRGGSVVDWVMVTEGVGFRHAVEILRERMGSAPLPEGEATSRESTGRNLASPLTLGAPDEVVMAQVVDYYHAVLKQTPAAQQYLTRRGIADRDAVEAFKLGFADRTLGLRLPKRKSEAGRQVRDQLERLGILKATGHEHFRGCLTVPVLDERDRVVEVYGRRVDVVKNGGSPHLYLPGPHKGVWNLTALRSSKEVILCEALVDGLTFYCAGFHNVTASFGTNGFTSDLAEALLAYGVERVLVAYDRDQAGDQAARKVAERLAGEGVSCFRVLFPRGLDANEYALKVKPASQSLAVLLRSAEWMAGPVSTPSTANRPTTHPTEDQGNACVITGTEPSPALAALSSSDEKVITQEIPASPDPPPPRLDLPAQVKDNEVVVRLGERRWRVRGLERNMSFEQMRVNLLVSQAGSEAYHVDTFDLYSARQRTAFVRQAAAELGVKQDSVKRDLGKVLLKLEQLQEERVAEALEADKERPPPLSEEERSEALELLQDPTLVQRIGADLSACGLVGEETNRLVGYLTAISRKLDRPLGVMIQSSSAAGKSALMSAVLACVPAEDKVSYSAMTGQSLFYVSSESLKHKVLAIAEEEGAERASYALKLLQSEGELSIASTGKDPATGRLLTHEYRVEGPVALLSTTTAVDLDEELLNRCVVLTVDESREQTRAIHRMQREAETLDGWRRRRRRERTLKLHQNAQRLLKPLDVVNPFARELRYPDACTRTRRDNEKYLSLIRAIALLRQRQREVKHDNDEAGGSRPYVEVTLEDVELANRLAAEVLGRTLDELPPHTAHFLELVHEWVMDQCQERGVEPAVLRFSRRELREATGWSYAQVRKHLDRLVELEYVLVHRGGRGQSFVYELLWDGNGVDGESFFMGLIDVEALRKTQARTTATLTPSESTLTPSEPDLDPPLTPGLPPVDPPLTPCQIEAIPCDVSSCSGEKGKAPENAHLEPSKAAGSYVLPGRSAKEGVA